MEQLDFERPDKPQFWMDVEVLRQVYPARLAITLTPVCLRNRIAAGRLQIFRPTILESRPLRRHTDDGI